MNAWLAFGIGIFVWGPCGVLVAWVLAATKVRHYERLAVAAKALADGRVAAAEYERDHWRDIALAETKAVAVHA